LQAVCEQSHQLIEHAAGAHRDLVELGAVLAVREQQLHQVGCQAAGDGVVQRNL
jgi:hypothetical protein